MKVEVKESLCIGCGSCVMNAPDVFSFNDDGYAVAIKEEISKENNELVKESINGCPTDAIKEIKNEI